MEACFLQNSVEYTPLPWPAYPKRGVRAPATAASRPIAEAGTARSTSDTRRAEVKTSFDGLCLDCETASGPASGEKTDE